jgi:hypothetical protein
MKRTIIVVAVAAGAVAAVTAVWLTVASHNNSTRQQPPSTASGSSADTRTAEQKAEDAFIGATAAHMCDVGQTVYDDAKALAAAYQSPPAYPGLTSQQVTDLTQRLRTDQTLNARLTQQLQATCKPPSSR